MNLSMTGLMQMAVKNACFDIGHKLIENTYSAETRAKYLEAFVKLIKQLESEY